MQSQEPRMGGAANDSSASPAATQAKEIARTGTEQVKELGQTAKERARREIESRRERIAGEFEALAGALEKHGSESEGARPVMGMAASGVRRLSTFLRDNSADDMLQTIRRSPGALLAGSFAVGFLALRLFRE